MRTDSFRTPPKAQGALATCFAVPVSQRWLVYAPLTGNAALVNAAAARRLAERDSGSVDRRLKEAFEAFAAEHHPAPQPRTGPMDPVFLGLIPTRACNLGCAYCGFGAREAPQFSLPHEDAVEAIDWMGRTAAANRDFK